MSRCRRLFATLALATLIIAGCSKPVAEPVVIKRPPPAGAPRSELLVLQDVELPRLQGERPRWLRIVAPLDGDELPVLLYSHAANLDVGNAADLMDYWARKRYVVIAVSHLDDHDFDAADQIVRRIEDLDAVLDRADQLSHQSPLLAGLMDFNRSAVAGHGVGAVAAAAICGLRIDAPAEVGSTRRAVRAGWLVDPIGIRLEGLEDAAWTDVRVPLGFSFTSAPSLGTWDPNDLPRKFSAERYLVQWKRVTPIINPLDRQYAELSSTFLHSFVNESGQALARLTEARKTFDPSIATVKKF